jgi:hypothetical protein
LTDLLLALLGLARGHRRLLDDRLQLGHCRGEASAPTWLAETARAVGLLTTIEVLRGPSAVTYSH